MLLINSCRGKTSQRKIDVNIILSETNDGFQLQLSDADGCSAMATVEAPKSQAINIEKAKDQIQKQLSKLGETPFAALEIVNHCEHDYFIPAAVLNELRRSAVTNLEQERLKKFHPKPMKYVPNEVPYFETKLDYRANILNHKAEQFYRRHGVTELEYGLEKTHDYEGKALMTTKYCLRYELHQCLQHKANSYVDADYQGPLYLRNNKNVFELKFDCKHCQMQIIPVKKNLS